MVVELQKGFSRPGMSYSYFVAILSQLPNLLLSLILLASTVLKLSRQLDCESFASFYFTCVVGGRSLTANFYGVLFILRNGRMGKKGYNPYPLSPRESLPIINLQSDRPHSRHSPGTVCLNLARRLDHFCAYRMQPSL